MAQEGLCDLAAGGLLWPRAATVPVITPTAKNPKYIRAAGCRNSCCNTGGSWKLTLPRLCPPIRTRKNRTNLKKTVLRTFITFITYHPPRPAPNFPATHHPPHDNLLSHPNPFTLCPP